MYSPHSEGLGVEICVTRNMYKLQTIKDYVSDLDYYFFDWIEASREYEQVQTSPSHLTWALDFVPDTKL